jgi:hypothetical protein
MITKRIGDRLIRLESELQVLATQLFEAEMGDEARDVMAAARSCRYASISLIDRLKRNEQ